jgi:RNA polymerase sigma factor for flagellar operon FliA
MSLTHEQRELVAGHVHIARRAALKARREPIGAYLTFDDMLSAAHLGLCQAVASWDAERAPFPVHARRRCYGAIVDEARRQDSQASMRSRGEREAGHRGRRAFSLDDTFRVDNSRTVDLAMSFHEVVGDERTITADLYELRERRQEVEDALDQLDQRLAATLRLTLYHDWTLRELGNFFGVSESRVCQLHRKALAQVRQVLGIEPQPQPKG